MSRALVVDGQLFHSLAFHRGMGKYSLSLLHELSAQSASYERLILVFNNAGLHHETIEIVQNVAPNFEIKFLELERSSVASYRDYTRMENSNKQQLDDYIRLELQDYDIDFLILSLFQDTECPTFPSRANKKCLLMYDLIPLQFPEFYLSDAYSSEVYLSRMKVMYEAEHFFAISDTVANDLSLHLGIPNERITAIYGAQIKRKQIKIKPYPPLLKQKFILLPTGDDYRKNNRRAVLAFNEFNKKQETKYKLVLTSFFSERTQMEFAGYCSDLIFTGNVSEEHLSWLYEYSEAVLFPSEYEGLGMPVIEAVEFNKPVICSNIPVFKELNDKAFCFCDPYDIESIEDALTKTISRKWRYEKKDYDTILNKYSWEKTANLLLDKLATMSDIKYDVHKPKIAVFAPAPNGYSAIGKVVQEQHYVLSKLAEVDYYLETGTTERAAGASLRKNFLPYVANCHDPWSYDEDSAINYDETIYHIGNSEYHIVALAKSLAFPATIVLHDTDIEGLYSIAHSAGIVSDARISAEGRLYSLISQEYGKYLSSVISKQRRIFVHSEYAKSAVEKNLIKGSVPYINKLNLPTPSPGLIYNTTDYARLTVSLAGIMSDAKGLGLIKTLAEEELAEREIIIKIFGFSLLSAQTEKELSKIPNLKIVSAPSDTRFLHELNESDIIINYRENYHGETSLSTLEALRLGRPVIVNNKGWFSELPDDIVFKVNEEFEIVSVLREVASISIAENKKAAVKRMKYIREDHNIKDYLKSITKNGNQK